MPIADDRLRRARIWFGASFLGFVIINLLAIFGLIWVGDFLRDQAPDGRLPGFARAGLIGTGVIVMLVVYRFTLYLADKRLRSEKRAEGACD